ncbi:MAG: RNA-binding S4 domain-containing protein [Candidatus Cloacimonetes bacterium]|nr:RNA-binding S4 domain-containing protein [Candidatus Cloacimonadota bacterium]
MKFWIEKGSDIYLFQLMKASGTLDDYQEIRHAITHGEVEINGTKALNQREILKHGDEVKYKNAFIEILVRGVPKEERKAPNEIQPLETKGLETKDIETNGLEAKGVEHGRIKRWAAKPLNIEKKIDDEIKDLILKLHNILIKKNSTLAFAESCTGGMLQNIVTDNSGCSAYFLGGITPYSDRAKMDLLNVSETTLASTGSVSKATAKEMVDGLKMKIPANICVAITGIAGPEGGTKEKPVGTVFTAILINNHLFANKYNFSGTRMIIRKKCALEILKIIYKNV